MSTKTHAVLENLDPGRTYDVKIKAHIDHDSQIFEVTSDSMQVTMLPKG